jgi:hypothetical protein
LLGDKTYPHLLDVIFFINHDGILEEPLYLQSFYLVDFAWLTITSASREMREKHYLSQR